MKTVVTIHGIEYEFLPEYYKFPQSLYLNKSTEYAVRKADRLIAVSKWTKKQMVERLGADETKIKVIYEGVGKRIVKAKKGQFKSNYMRYIRQKYGLKKPYILFVGTIQPRKNLVRLIEAFSRLLKLFNKVDSSLAGARVNTPMKNRGSQKGINLAAYQLVIAGKKGWLDEKIYQAPEKYGVSKRVRFTGRVAEPDLAAVYKGAELFCWPSLMEGFGLPVLEAMSLGVPVVTSNRGALPEVVGKAGLMVDPTRVEDITEAMKLVLESKELKQGLVEKGYRQVKKFSWEKAAKETLEVLTKKW